jgi:hypothetical protein
MHSKNQAGSMLADGGGNVAFPAAPSSYDLLSETDVGLSALVEGEGHGSGNDLRSELDLILRSKTFAKTKTLTRFLQYVVEASLAGRAGSLKQYCIGVDVFDRDGSFDPSVDPIVRVQAGRLRARLDHYYRTEGSSSAVRIDLPKGRYAPLLRQLREGKTLRDDSAKQKGLLNPTTATGLDWRILPRPPLDHPDHDLLWETEQVCRELLELREAPRLCQSFDRRLAEYYDDLKRISALVSRREYAIAIIGEHAIRKSVTICKMIGLEIPHPGGWPTTPVLQFGPGHTTLCEVRLRTGPEFGVLVEPCAQAEILGHVRDFADRVFRRLAVSDQSFGHDNFAELFMSEEIERAVRNMAGLKVYRHTGPDGKSIRRDHAEELATQFRSPEEYALEVLTLMSHSRRDSRNIWYDYTTGNCPLVWLKETFERINSGQHPDFTLPARIEIVIPRPLLGPTDLKISLIDTRPISGLTARHDLDEYLDESHTLTLLCSGLNKPLEPACRLLLERAKESNIRNTCQNVALLLLSAANEADAVSDEADVLTESDDDEFQSKLERVRQELEPLGLQSLTIGFFDVCRDDSSKLRTLMLNCIERIHDGFKRRLRESIESVRTVMLRREEVEEVAGSAATIMKSWLDQHRTPPTRSGRVHDSLLSQLRIADVRTIRASIRRGGECCDFSYGHHLGYGARKLAVLALEPLLEAFNATTESMERDIDCANTKHLIKQVRRVLGVAFRDILRKIQIAGQTIYMDALRLDPIFWEECNKEWGHGSGYRGRISTRNESWFDAKTRSMLERELWYMVSREWTITLKRASTLLECEGQNKRVTTA